MKIVLLPVWNALLTKRIESSCIIDVLVAFFFVPIIAFVSGLIIIIIIIIIFGSVESR